MNELKRLITQMTDDLKEINGILAARSRELDRRAEFDKKISEEILQNNRYGKGNKN